MADMFTKAGVKILMPISNYSFRLLPKTLCIRTGTPPEQIYTVLGYVLFILNIAISILWV